jgi:hypothetical protein
MHGAEIRMVNSQLYVYAHYSLQGIIEEMQHSQECVRSS